MTMQIDFLTTDDERRHRRPSWQAIERAIRRLDGHERSTVLITIGEEELTALSIDGGGDGYVVEATLDTATFYYLRDPSKDERLTKRVVGGQAIDWPENLVVGLQAALQAARTFAETGRIDGTLDWSEH